MARKMYSAFSALRKWKNNLGKTIITKQIPSARVSISATSRELKTNEKHNEDYFLLTERYSKTDQ